MEEGGVELPRMIDESATPDVQPSGTGWVRVVELVDIEALAGNLADRVDAFPEVLPEAPWRVRVAGKTTADSHDGDRQWLAFVLHTVDRCYTVHFPPPSVALLEGSSTT